MKRNLIVILLLCGFSAFSQHDNQPPRQFVESFHKEYPQSQATNWTHNGNDWSARFEDRDHDNGEVIAHFDHNARHTDTYIAYDNNDVPESIMKRIHEKYSGMNDYEVTRMEHRGSHEYYQVRFHDKDRDRTVYFDHRGNEKKYPYHEY